eukprot:Gb_23568 [translate_table: standard]
MPESKGLASNLFLSAFLVHCVLTFLTAGYLCDVKWNIWQRERLALLEAAECGEKSSFKPIIYFQSWRLGLFIFALGNCLNFISFGYAAQSLLAALGSVQFISNVAFAYFVLKEKVTGRVLLATAFIVFGNIFLVAFGNHQSLVYTPEQLMDKYTNHVFLLYCLGVVLIVAVNHSVYRRGERLLSISGRHNLRSYWHQLLPLSYAIVSGAIGSHSVLFAKSLYVGLGPVCFA